MTGLYYVLNLITEASNSMSIFEHVIILTRKLEGILENEFQADGRGLHEKINSVENHLPDFLKKKLRYTATVRNKLMHEDGFVIPQPEVFISTAKQAINELKVLSESKTQQGRVFVNAPMKPSSSPGLESFAVMAIAAVIALIVGVFLLYSLAQNILDPI